MNVREWYSRLKKPFWAPPASLFRPVWIFIYVFIAVSYGNVFFLFLQNNVSFMVVVPFMLNLVFNFSFIPLQFGLKNNLLATIDILLVLGTLIWAMTVIFPYVQWITYVQIPYLLWVMFAAALQLTITYLNK